MHEVLTTLAACHEKDIYHGDVKPANFMLTQLLDPSRPLEDLERYASAHTSARLSNPEVLTLSPTLPVVG